MSEKLGPLPDTEWLLHMPAQPYESEWTSSMAGYTEEQMREYAAQEVAKERERCAKLCDERYALRARDGLPREASTARSLAAEIRGTKSAAIAKT